MAAEGNFSLFRDQPFTQCGECDGEFDGGARLGAAGERQLLVHHGQHASAGGLDGDHRAVHIAQSIDRRLAHDRIFPIGNIAASKAFGVGTHEKALVIAVSAKAGGGSG